MTSGLPIKPPDGGKVTSAPAGAITSAPAGPVIPHDLPQPERVIITRAVRAAEAAEAAAKAADAAALAVAAPQSSHRLAFYLIGLVLICAVFLWSSVAMFPVAIVFALVAFAWARFFDHGHRR